MKNNHTTSPETFAELYTVHINVVVENLEILKQLLDREDYLLDEARAGAYLRVCAILLVSACRTLADASAPDFPEKADGPATDDLRRRRRNGLFSANARRIFRIRPDEPIKVMPNPRDVTEIEKVHRVAESLMFSREARCLVTDRSAALASLHDGHKKVADFVRCHGVTLREWRCHCIISVNDSGDAQWRLLRTPSIKCSGSGRSRRLTPMNH